MTDTTTAPNSPTTQEEALKQANTKKKEAIRELRPWFLGNTDAVVVNVLDKKVNPLEDVNDNPTYYHLKCVKRATKILDEVRAILESAGISVKEYSAAQRKAAADIADNLKQAETFLEECCNLSREYGIPFYLGIPGGGENEYDPDTGWDSDNC